MLLLLSGIQPNPGPICNTSSELKNLSGLHILHKNDPGSLLQKLDTVEIWANSSDADVMVFSET